MSDPKKPEALPTGPERELQIYALGLNGGKPAVPVPLELLEQKAKEILSPRAYDYVAGGAGGEDTVRPNPGAFFNWQIIPRAPLHWLETDFTLTHFADHVHRP